MKALFRKTLNLFVTYPVLWLPFVVTELLSIGLSSLHNLARKPLFDWFATRHTAYGGEIHVYDQVAQHKTMMALFPLDWGTHYLVAYLTAGSLVLTAALVAMVLHGEKPDLAPAVADLRRYPRRIAFYALKYWALSLLLYALIVLPTSSLYQSLPNLTLTNWNVIWGSGALLTMLLSAWIMAPISLALLRPADAAPVSSGQKGLARYFSIAVTVAVFLLARLLDPLILKLIGKNTYGHAIFSLTSLPIHLPSVLLLIAIALIASEEPQPDFPPLGPRIRKILEPFMPLHFGPGADGPDE
jgi:hypothetical protein